MKSNTRRLLFAAVGALATASAWAASPMREATLRRAAINAGLVPVKDVMPDFSPAASRAGELLFKSKLLSLNRETSCQTCHLDRFSSADGLPNAVGTGGHGEGIERLQGGGDIVPRNTLPLWGRGSIGFNVFFWDGKVDGSGNRLLSQFGDNPPSQDPLVTAVHLPIVELREMVSDTDKIGDLITENVSSAEAIYAVIVERLRGDDEIGRALSEAFEIERSRISIGHIAQSLADFIRDKFRLRDTRLHRFVFEGGELTDEEIAGGLLFYGKGQCANCHNGPTFSDLKFHAIPFGQLGFGRNGFGIDQGRFNVTLDPNDYNRFRTPPLLNVAHTAPYSHSGQSGDLTTTILAHVDPLAVDRIDSMNREQRSEYYQMLKIWSQTSISNAPLDDKEIRLLVLFLELISFEATQGN